LNPDLKKLADQYIKRGRIRINEDNYNSGPDFTLEEEVEDILELFTEDREFENLSYLHEQLHRADYFYGYNPDPELSRINAVQVVKFQEHQEQLHGPQPLTMCNRDIMQRFKDHAEDMELLLTYLGLKSLIGRKSWQRTTKQAVISRMVGAKNAKALRWVLDNNPECKLLYERFVDDKGTIRRHRFEQLIHRLINQGFFQSYFGYGRSIFFSFTLDMDQLTEAVMTWKSNRDHHSKEKLARYKIRKKIPVVTLN
jgi:hypothetical protein